MSHLDFDRVKRLHEASSGQDKAEISLLHNAVLERMSAYKDKSTRANKIDWDAAKEGLSDCTSRLWPKYFPEDSVITDPQRFERQKDALAWLHAKGYKVSGGKFSNDWNSGKVKVYQGGVSFAALLEYAATLDIDHKKIANSEQRAARKDDLEIRRLEQQVEKGDIENRKDDVKWVLREASIDQAAALLILLRSALRHHFGVKTPVIIHAAAGDPARAVELESVLQETISAAFNEMAATREARQIGLVDHASEEEDEN
jgi:hypothetical protein